MSHDVEERLRQVDPEYGSQRHQRAFIERMREVQRRAPCSKDHEHSSSCYPAAVMRAVCDEQERRERAENGASRPKAAR